MAVGMALLGFLFVHGLVPQGFMAAPVSEGSLFHLCPGDAGSAEWLKVAAANTHHGSGDHPHHAEGHEGSGNLSQDRADAACSFGAAGTAIIADYSPDATASPGASSPPEPLPWAAPISRSWLRPPPRSPPA
jgi:hypothetical protein